MSSLKRSLLSLLRKVLVTILGWTPVQWGLIYVLPKLRLTNGYGKATSADFRAIKNLARPGDLIFSLDRSKLSSLLIPGKWEHVAIVASNEVELEIIEAVPIHGVRKIAFYDFLKTADEVMLMRRSAHRQGDEESAVRWAVAFMGMKYDTNFERGPEALYCAELVADCYTKAKFDWSDLWGIGMQYLSPDGVASCTDDFYTLYQSRQ